MFNRFGSQKAGVAGTDGSSSRAPVYLYFAKFGDRIKIGASRDVPARLKQISMHCGYVPELIGTHVGSFGHEAAVHYRLTDHCIVGEWYSDNTEVRAFIDRCLDDLDLAISHPDGAKNRFGLVARLLWPKDTITMLCQISNADVLEVQEWMEGAEQPPASVVLAVIHEMMREQTELNL